MAKHDPEEMNDFAKERDTDSRKILDSCHPRKVVVAGPGTGKTFLFEKAIQRKREQGKTNVLAITFIGKLSDALADDLAGMAKTMTLHGFARKLILDELYKDKGWDYYPGICEIIMEDLSVSGHDTALVGDSDYFKRSKYYQCVGDQDVVHYAVNFLEKHRERIPTYDLVLIDEFQDFNETEARLIDILASRNEIVVVGDDDQALYQFKGASPRFIREKHSADNKEFESHTLRFCSRCTEATIGAFHNIVKEFGLNDDGNERIAKELLCYLPDKEEDSKLNPHILLMKSVPLGSLPKRIKDELASMLERQKVKSVLIIGEARSCKKMLETIARKMKTLGFQNIDSRYNTDAPLKLKQRIVDGLMQLESNPRLGWRLLVALVEDDSTRKKIIQDNLDNPKGLIAGIPATTAKRAKENAELLNKIMDGADSKIKKLHDSAFDGLADLVVETEKPRREHLVRELRRRAKHVRRPLANLDITVTNVLGAKGLGADVVFFIGFDKKKFPMQDDIELAEVYQMLVALTRAKKRLYLVNSVGCEVSCFLSLINRKYWRQI